MDKETYERKDVVVEIGNNLFCAIVGLIVFGIIAVIAKGGGGLILPLSFLSLQTYLKPLYMIEYEEDVSYEFLGRRLFVINRLLHFFFSSNTPQILIYVKVRLTILPKKLTGLPKSVIKCSCSESNRNIIVRVRANQTA